MDTRIQLLILGASFYIVGCESLATLGIAQAEPDALARASLTEETSIGVMVAEYSDFNTDAMFLSEGPSLSGFRAIDVPKPDVGDPAPVIAPLVVKHVEEELGVRAKTINTAIPRGNVREVAMRDGKSNGVDAVLFVSINAIGNYFPGDSDDRPGYAYGRVQLSLNLWAIDGTFLWSSALTESATGVIGYISVYESQMELSSSELLEDFNLVYDGSIDAVAKEVPLVIRAMAADAGRQPDP